VLDRSGLPADVSLEFLAGLPYLQEIEGRQRKIVSLTAACAPTPFALGIPDAGFATSGAVTAGKLAIRSAGRLRVVNPPSGPNYFNSPRTIGLTQEQLAFSLASDPRGYGDPDSGWHRVAGTNLVLADPVPGAPPGLAIFAVSYGPASDPSDYAVTAETRDDRVVIRTPQFSALIGHPAGDGHGEPTLALTSDAACDEA
jgi:hypothetical protein